MHHTFKPGQVLRVNEPTMSDDSEGVERCYPAGAKAIVAAVHSYGVDVVIEGEIVNTFEGDECRVLELVEVAP